ncbi:MAG: type I-B CRISPR-associated protein Cas7/Cst2/DevR [Candidatus Ratteibacteria bacterium]
MKNAITITILFEADALNRDEKVGNVLSIKKLTRGWKNTYPYISKYALRHYLFTTLVRGYGWVPAPLRVLKEGKTQIVQFDLLSSNIISSAELDIFGYMFTVGGQLSLTRKAPLGITKAIAFENWEGDMGLNANHDLAQRSGATPIPVNREEGKSFFKVSFTLDIDKIGSDSFDIEEFRHDDKSKNLTLFIKKGKKFTIENIEEKDEEGKGKMWSVKEEFEIWEKERMLYFKPLKEKVIEEYNEKEGILKIKSDNIKVSGKEKKEFTNVVRIEENGETIYVFPYLHIEPKLEKETKKLILALGLSQTIEEVDEVQENKEYKVYNKVLTFRNVDEIEKDKKYKSVEGTHILIIEMKEDEKDKKRKVYIQNKEIGEIKENPLYLNGKLKIVLNEEAGIVKIEGKKVFFILHQNEKEKRIREVLNAIYNGLYYHSSGESPGIVPLFLIAGVTKLPVPVFHSFVDIEFYKQNHRPRFKIREDLLKNAIKNGWIEREEGERKPLVFIESREPQAIDQNFIAKNSITDWNEFIDNWLFYKRKDGSK